MGAQRVLRRLQRGRAMRPSGEAPGKRRLPMGPRPLPFRSLGGIAQLARASALQAEGLGFESPCLHWIFCILIAKGWKDDMVK